ncbi:methyl-accepting chemotaxis protein [Paenibacillus cremeus]|uniref:Methyl-accepting chemotaxis protein n=1 Tax=Paenibacillus cremeus TaxID=2163881 RepID=A0A559K890_9BACL|nr:methyl-accepting chemotaxis protein [Paenibacillus cremeus]TVY08303.1 methyl-accepting chemotaxis protein [Paenibacillus cremeus]
MMKKMTIRTKLILGISTIVLLFAASFLVSLFLQKQRTELSSEIAFHRNILSHLQSLSETAIRVDDYGSYYMLEGDGKQTKYFDKYSAALKSMLEEAEAVKQMQLDPEQVKTFADFEADWSKYQKGNEDIFRQYRSGDIQKAQKDYANVPFDNTIQILRKVTGQLQADIEALENSSEAKEKLASTLNMWIIVAATVIGIGFALLLARRITAPILVVNRQLKEIAEGEGDLTRRITVRSNDEIGDLADSFNQMMGKLQRLIREVAQHAKQVAESSLTLRESSMQTSSASEHIAETCQEAATGAEKQAAGVSSGTIMMNEMAKAVLEIAGNAQNATVNAMDSSKQAKSGNESIQTAIGRMNSIQSTVASLDVSVRGLGMRSQEIGQIVTVITGLAAQTNLLALNATIEAARAGEAGRGFAVVASEVRKLADQSNQSAEQIAELIQSIQADTQHAIIAMKAGSDEVEAGSQEIRKAGEAFGQIMLAIDQVAGSIEEVSAATEQMAASTDEVVNTLNHITILSQEAASGTQNISAATEEQLASMEEITATSSTLLSLAEELQDLVSKFKV